MTGSGRERALGPRRPRTVRCAAAVVGVAALAVALSACVPDDTIARPSTSVRPSVTAIATTTPTSLPTATSTPTATGTPTPPPDTRSSVDVVIVNWNGGQGQVSASGIVPGITEDGGTCTLTAASAAGTFTGTTPAQQATSSTDCGVIAIAVPAGDWTLTLSYDSPDAVGASQPETATAT